jgi:hypothetical protein
MMAIELDSKDLHELTLTFLVEISPDFDPRARAIEIYGHLVEQELIEGMVISRIEEIPFDLAFMKYDPKIWGTHILCSTACDVNAGCECHGGYGDE